MDIVIGTKRARRKLTMVTALATAMVAISARADLVIEHVNVISMLPDREVQLDMDVFIENDRIGSITPASQRVATASATRIDGRGRWLMPGLADMHVHLENDRLARLVMDDPAIPDGAVRLDDALLPYVANGVLQIAVLSSTVETIAQRDEVEAGRVLGPRIALAAMIDGTPPAWPPGMTRVASNPSEGRQAVRDIAAEGYDFVKAYERLDLDTFLAVCDEARKLNLKVIGHLPQDGKGLTREFFVPGLGMVAHAEELAQQSNPPAIERIAEYARWAGSSGTWLTATLALDERILEMMSRPDSLQERPELRYMSPMLQRRALEGNQYVESASQSRMEHVRRIIEFNRKLIPAFAAAGIPIVAGSDALVPGIVPGFSLHDELEALAKAGLSNRQVLESATRLPAEWLGTLDDRGVVAPGKRADLLLLDDNPLDRIENTRRIAGFIVGGEYHSRAELDTRMEALRRRNSLGQ